jgi:hypothetical protein
MNKVQTTIQSGKKIIIIDLSNCTPESAMLIIPEAAVVISGQPLKSALVLTDVTNAHYTKEVAGEIKNFVQENTPYIKASAVVGADGIRSILLNTVILISRREIKTFNDRSSAMSWLTTI